MKKNILLIILIVNFTPAFATNEEDTIDIKSPKIQTVQNNKTQKVEKPEKDAGNFGTLRKSSSNSKNIF